MTESLSGDSPTTDAEPGRRAGRRLPQPGARPRRGGAGRGDAARPPAADRGGRRSRRDDVRHRRRRDHGGHRARGRPGGRRRAHGPRQCRAQRRAGARPAPGPFGPRPRDALAGPLVEGLIVAAVAAAGGASRAEVAAEARDALMGKAGHLSRTAGQAPHRRGRRRRGGGRRRLHGREPPRPARPAGRPARQRGPRARRVGPAAQPHHGRLVRSRPEA